jgi:hypothetical protein
MAGAINSMEDGAEYGWLIDESYIEEDTFGKPTTIEVFGPSGISHENVESLKRGEGASFELYDDDDILYYKGRIIGSFSGLEPMEDFGMPNAGAVHTKMDGEYI